ncbi:MAG TPA: arylesterase [Chitinophagaceae bacterium]|nr:arylesterase [Chitinophagaceae bacterium]
MTKGCFPATITLFMIMLMSCGTNQGPADKPAADTVAKQPAASANEEKTIVFFGNSLTAGYGVEPGQAFPAIIQHYIDSLDLPYKVVNAGVSGETSSGGNSRVDWILKQPLDIFVLELGANDGLRGVSPSETRKNLQSIIDKVKAKYPAARIVIAGMMLPPNMGQQYTNEFRSIFPELAKTNNATLIPFLLEGVGGEARFNQQDGIHPTPEGHEILARNVWKVMKDML